MECVMDFIQGDDGYLETKDEKESAENRQNLETNKSPEFVYR